MSVYYIYVPETDTSYSLDSTSKISKTLKAKVTENIVESGNTLVDHYYKLPEVFSLQGKITRVGNRETKEPIDFIKGLNSLMVDKTIFSFFYGKEIPEAETCVLESLTIRQDSRTGYVSHGEDYSSAYEISLTIKTVRFAESATITHERDPNIADAFTSEEESSLTTEEASDASIDLIAQGVLLLDGTLGLDRLETVIGIPDNPFDF